MTSSTVTLRGADRLRLTARAAARDLEHLAATNARIASGLRAAAHPPRRTGRLANSLTSTSNDTEAAVTSSVPYAGIVEARTGFLAAALEHYRTSALEHYTTATNAAVAGIKGA